MLLTSLTWRLLMELNHHLLVRSKVSYPLKEGGITGCGGGIRNLWAELMRLTDRLNPRNMWRRRRESNPPKSDRQSGALPRGLQRHISFPDRTFTDNILDTLNLAFLMERAFFTRLTRNLGAGRGIEPHSPPSDQPLRKHHVRPRHKLGGVNHRVKLSY